MAKYIRAVEAAEKVEGTFKIPMADLVDIFAEIPAAGLIEAQAKEIDALRNELCLKCGNYTRPMREPVADVVGGGKKMDALEFLKERKRMCRSFCGSCRGCPCEKVRCALNSLTSDDDYKRIVAAVEEWSAAHQLKTRQSVFLEQFPNAPIYTNTHNVALDPCLVDTTLRGHCPTGRGCDICRREFWMQEVE